MTLCGSDRSDLHVESLVISNVSVSTLSIPSNENERAFNIPRMILSRTLFRQKSFSNLQESRALPRDTSDRVDLWNQQFRCGFGYHCEIRRHKQIARFTRIAWKSRNPPLPFRRVPKTSEIWTIDELIQLIRIKLDIELGWMVIDLVADAFVFISFVFIIQPCDINTNALINCCCRHVSHFAIFCCF